MLTHDEHACMCTRSSSTEVVIPSAAVFSKLRTLNPTRSEFPYRIPSRVQLELHKFRYIPLTILFNNSIEKDQFLVIVMQK